MKYLSFFFCVIIVLLPAIAGCSSTSIPTVTSGTVESTVSNYSANSPTDSTPGTELPEKTASETKNPPTMTKTVSEPEPDTDRQLSCRPTAIPSGETGITVELGKKLIIVPNQVILPPGASCEFRTCISDSGSEPVAFSLVESGSGTISADGRYVAPQHTGTYHLNAVSKNNLALSATAEIVVYQGHQDLTSPGIHMLQDGWILETLTPQFPMGGAPFDVAILPDGRIITIGVDSGKKTFASIDLSGKVVNTAIPSQVNRGGYFEASDDGRVWFWENMAGRLWVSAEGDDAPVLVTGDLPEDGYGGSMAVSPDGQEIYIIWGGPEMNSALFRYKPDSGLETILDGEDARALSCVEITRQGMVYIIRDKCIYLLEAHSRLAEWLEIGFETGIQPDSLTSDDAGNLYFAGSWGNREQGVSQNGIYRISSEKMITLYAEYPDIYLPGGMAWDTSRQVLFGAQKINNNVAVYSPAGVYPLLDSSMYLNLPMALAFTPEGELLINYEEAGLFKLDEYYRASPFCLELVCFGPPTAGMVVDHNNAVYYTACAPDLPRDIMKIDSAGNAVSILRPDGMAAGIDIGPDGRIFYADWAGCAVHELHADGTSTLYRSGIPYPLGLVVDADYNFWITAAAEGATAAGNPYIDCFDAPRPRVLKLDPEGNLTEVFNAAGLHTSDQVYLGYLDIDTDGTVYVPDGNLLYAVKEGQHSIIAVGLNAVSSVKFGPDGCLYLTDSSGGKLFRLHREE